MKKEWRKHEKQYYLTGKNPVYINIPELKFFSIKGTGNPNSEAFTQYIGVLYSLSYTVKMSYKWKVPPAGYYEYTVYPLEGVWDIADKSKYVEGVVDKDNLAFTLMIRQPEFITDELAQEIAEKAKKKKPNELLDSVIFSTETEGPCIQMLHYGSYDDEPTSFKKMESFAIDNGMKRLYKSHREIYLSDPRKVEPSKLKTLLRFKIEKI